jgi:hypothetical protein
MLADGLAQQSFGPVTVHRLAHTSPGGKAKATGFEATGRDDQDRQWMVEASAIPVQAIKIRRMPQSQASLHALGMLAARGLLGRPITDRPRTLPVDTLDMVVHFYAQRAPALLASVLDDVASSFCLHSLTETMYPQTTADFWLVSTFWHNSNLPKKQGP